MISIQVPPGPFRRTGRAACAVALLSLVFSHVRADTKAGAPAGPAPKTHVLFMGADVALEKDKEFFVVQDVREGSLIVHAQGKPKVVRMNPQVVLQVTEVLKIADTSVDVGKFKFERAYTPAADPFLKFTESARVAATMAAAADEANLEVNRATANLGIAQAQMASAPPQAAAEMGPGLAQAQADLEAAQTSAAMAGQVARSEVFDVSSQSSQLTSDLSQEMFDAIRFSFEVVADRDLAQPYYAVIAQIRSPDSKPGEGRKWVYVRPLNAMSKGEPRRVEVYRGGMSPGYVLESCEIHVYNGGEELATNLSKKRVELSDDDVLQYRIIEYVGANKDRTLPATPLSATLKGELRARLTPVQMDITYYVRVTKAGKVSAAFLDEAGQRPLQDSGVDAVLKALRFKPALQSGKPVESLAPFRFDQLARE